jgi:hypothetical protein
MPLFYLMNVSETQFRCFFPDCFQVRLNDVDKEEKLEQQQISERFSGRRKDLAKFFKKVFSDLCSQAVYMPQFESLPFV